MILLWGSEYNTVGEIFPTRVFRDVSRDLSFLRIGHEPGLVVGEGARKNKLVLIEFPTHQNS